MKEQSLWSRENLDLLPGVPLPLYVRSCGVKVLGRGERGFSPGGRNRFVEFVFCFGGTGRVFLFDRAIQLRAGEGFCYQPGEEHLFCSDSAAWELRWAALDGPLALALVASYEYPRHFAIDLQRVGAWMAELGKWVTRPGVAAARRATGTALALVHGCMPEAQPFPEPGTVREIAKFIGDNLSKKELNVNMIADHFLLHRSTLNRLFEREFGRSPRDYLTLRRLERAKTLLADSRLTVREIAARCGYGTSAVFCRMFRRYQDRTPSRYRQEAGEKA